MIHGITIVFLILSALFAGAHALAVELNLYWYHWWFDIVMHFTGGILITLGLHTLSTFSRFTFTPTLRLLLATLLFMTVSWEVFEYAAGLWQPATYVTDTLQDIVIGFCGGLLAHVFLRHYTVSNV